MSLGNLLQGAWALLLHQYSRERDVVFGTTRTLRGSGPNGTADIVGLLINTLPVRVSLDPSEPLAPWLRTLRQSQSGLRGHEHTPLVRIQEWSELPRGKALFDTIEVAIKSIHPYDVPEIVAIKLDQGSEDYLKWIDSCVSIR